MDGKPQFGGYSMDWATKIKILRDKMLLTQTELGNLLGVSFSTVSRWEKGHHEPTMKQKRKLKSLMIANKTEKE